MRARELQGVLNAHPFVVVQQPPELWGTEVGLEPFVRLLGEMLAAALVRNGHDLSAITLNVANVTAQEDPLSQILSGDFVAITVRCEGDWSPEGSWLPSHAADRRFISEDFEGALADAQAAFGYVRVLQEAEDPVTDFLRRQAESPAECRCRAG